MKASGHKVTVKRVNSTTTVNVLDPVSEDKELLVNDIISYLRTKPDFFEAESKLESGKHKPVQKLMLQIFLKMYTYIELDSLINAIEEAALSRDSRKLQNLELALTFATLADGDLLKSRIRHYIKVGEEYTSMELYNCISYALTESNIGINGLRNKRAIEICNLFYETKRDTKKRTRLIVGENPYNVKVLKQTKEINPKEGVVKVKWGKMLTPNEIAFLLNI